MPQPGCVGYWRRGKTEAIGVANGLGSRLATTAVGAVGISLHNATIVLVPVVNWNPHNGVHQLLRRIGVAVIISQAFVGAV